MTEKQTESAITGPSSAGDDEPLAPLLDIATQPIAHSSPTVMPIIAIGASAGGLEAVSKLFDTLPSDTGMAFILGRKLINGLEVFGSA